MVVNSSMHAPGPFAWVPRRDREETMSKSSGSQPTFRSTMLAALVSTLSAASGCGAPPADAELSPSDAGLEDKALTGTPSGAASGSCSDKNTNCAAWARRGECTKNPGYMLTSCCASCNGGGSTGGTTGGDCHSVAPGHSAYCSSGCRCDEGEGDCDSDAECSAGLVCEQRSGTDYCVATGGGDGACQSGNAVLDLHVHLMRGVAMTVQGVRMTTDHITGQDVERTIVPGMNQAWAPAKIQFRLQKVLEEQVVKGATYQADLACVQDAVRDGDGRADDTRLPCLYRMMRPENMTRGDGPFHVYVFPFTGNTSQGNAMRAYNWHTVLGAFTNKHNGGRQPARMPLGGFTGIGSIARTAAHEQGHVLGLGHNTCQGGACLMNGSTGSTLAAQEITTAKAEAQRRSACR